MEDKETPYKLAKAPTVAGVKKPLKKSLPKLPSEDKNLLDEKKKPRSCKNSISKVTSESLVQLNNMSEEKSEAASDAQKKEAETTAEPTKSQPNVDDEEFLGDEEQTTFIPESVMV